MLRGSTSLFSGSPAPPAPARRPWLLRWLLRREGRSGRDEGVVRSRRGGRAACWGGFVLHKSGSRVAPLVLQVLSILPGILGPRLDLPSLCLLPQPHLSLATWSPGRGDSQAGRPWLLPRWARRVRVGPQGAAHGGLRRGRFAGLGERLASVVFSAAADGHRGRGRRVSGGGDARGLPAPPRRGAHRGCRVRRVWEPGGRRARPVRPLVSEVGTGHGGSAGPRWPGWAPASPSSPRPAPGRAPEAGTCRRLSARTAVSPWSDRSDAGPSLKSRPRGLRGRRAEPEGRSRPDWPPARGVRTRAQNWALFTTPRFTSRPCKRAPARGQPGPQNIVCGV